MINNINNQSGAKNSSMDDFDRLLASLFDGGLSDAQWNNLCQKMADDPDARQRYIQFVQLHSLLETRYSLQQPTLPDGTDEPGTVHGDAARELENLARQQHARGSIKTAVQKKKSVFAVTRSSAWRIAAVLVFVATAVMTLTSPAWLNWKKAAPLATLADAVDAQWDMPLGVGDDLPSGPLVLKAGYAHITLANGVNLVLKGPAHFSVESLLRVQLEVGKLTADVPHTASGFTVQCPNASITDLGTTFGVTAFLNHEATVQVLKGKVQAKLLDEDGVTKAQTELTQDHAVAMNPFLGTMNSMPATPDAYVTDIHHIPAAPQTAYNRWLAYSTKLRNDPSLLAYYTFDNKDEAPERLLNRSRATAGRYDGTLGYNGDIQRRPQWSTGRWAGKGALDFNGTHNTCVVIPQTAGLVPTHGLTLAVWYKPRSPEKTGHIINQMAARDPRFDLVWLGSDRQSKIAVEHGIYFDWGTGSEIRAVTLPQKSDWTFLAITCDANGHTVFYLNGHAEATTQQPPPVPATNPMVIGAFGLDMNNDIQPLDGVLDELAIFSRPLDVTEIEAMYQVSHHEK